MSHSIHFARVFYDTPRTAHEQSACQLASLGAVLSKVALRALVPRDASTRADLARSSSAGRGRSDRAAARQGFGLHDAIFVDLVAQRAQADAELARRARAISFEARERRDDPPALHLAQRAKPLEVWA